MHNVLQQLPEAQRLRGLVLACSQRCKGRTMTSLLSELPKAKKVARAGVGLHMGRSLNTRWRAKKPCTRLSCWLLAVVEGLAGQRLRHKLCVLAHFKACMQATH
eukprot:1078851-Pelagomonas_calceolata.AAC.3